MDYSTTDKILGEKVTVHTYIQNKTDKEQNSGLTNRKIGTERQNISWIVNIEDTKRYGI